MNKLFSKIAALSVGLTLAIGVGVAAGGNTAKGAKAATTVTWAGTTALPGSATAIAGDENVTIKTSSTNTYTNPIRIYANTTITIEAKNSKYLTSVTYAASSTGNYVTYAKEATVSPSVTPSVSDKNVTWEFSLSDKVSTFTFKPAAQTRSNGISVTYDAGSSDTKYTVHYDANLEAYTGEVPADQTQASIGAAITVADALSLEGYNFLGWNTSEDGGQTTRIAAKSSYTPAADTTLYGEWSEITPTYQKITDLSKADKVIITSEYQSKNYYLEATTTDSSPKAKTCTITDGELTGVSASNLFTVTLIGNNEYKFVNSSGKCLNTTNASTGIKINDDTDSYLISATDDGFSMQSVNCDRYVGIYNASDWRSYTSTSQDGYKGSATKINFYGISKDLGDLTKIELSGEYPTEFKQGATFSHEGMVVTATYSKGAEVDVTSLATFTGYDLSNPGDQTVTVSFTDGVTKTATYDIKVKSSISLAAAGFQMSIGDADVAPVVTIKDTTTVVEGCTFESKNTSIATVVNGKIHAVSGGTATITASHADDGDNVYTPVDFTVRVLNIETIQSVYSKTSGSVETAGYYAGTFADGIIIMDGAYGMLIYKATPDESWIVDSTPLHIVGTLKIYNQLYEIQNATVTLLTNETAISNLSKPTNYALTGSESTEDLTVANRRTFVSGKLTSLTSGSGGYDLVVGGFALYLKNADNVEITLKDETKITIYNYLNNNLNKNVTIKGFTNFYNAFQVRVYDIVEQDDSYKVEQFAQQLLDETDVVCSVWDGKSSNKEALTEIWNHLGGDERWQALSPEEQAKFTDANANYKNDSTDVVENAAGRYDMLCKKYFQTSNFAKRDYSKAPVQPEMALALFGVEAEADNSMIIIVSIAATTAVAFAALLIIKKKKHN